MSNLNEIKMKKIIIVLLGVFLFAFLSEAQDKTTSIDLGNTLKDLSFSAADTVSNNKTTYTIEYDVPQKYSSVQDLTISFDSISGTPALKVHMLASKWKNTWIAISDTVTWNGSGPSKIIEVSNANTNNYRYFRHVVTVTGTGKALITDNKFKIYFK
jgi:hypothetical protein